MYTPKFEDTHVFRARHGKEPDWLIIIFPEGRETTPDWVELPDGPYDIDPEMSEKVRMYLRVHQRARGEVGEDSD